MFRDRSDGKIAMKCGLKERGSTGNGWVVLDRDEDHGGQVTKGVWGMSWRQKAMKGVEGCEKPGEAVKQALIPGSPNVIRGIHRRMRQTR
jgi:hypothetical protein